MVVQFPPHPFAPVGLGGQDINMEEDHPQTVLGNNSGLPPSPPGDAKGVNTTTALQPGETLIVYHPHSQCPARIIPTAKLQGPSERTTQHDTKGPETAYAPFPTQADFKQAKIFVNNNCSNQLIDTQLKFAHRNGMHLSMKSSHEMHKLLACSVEEVTNDSKVSFTGCTKEKPHSSQDNSQFCQEEIMVPYIQGGFKEEQMYTVRYRPVMDAVLHTIEDRDLQGVLNVYPEQRYVHDPHSH